MGMIRIYTKWAKVCGLYVISLQSSLKVRKFWPVFCLISANLTTFAPKSDVPGNRAKVYKMINMRGELISLNYCQRILATENQENVTAYLYRCVGGNHFLIGQCSLQDSSPRCKLHCQRLFWSMVSSHSSYRFCVIFSNHGNISNKNMVNNLKKIRKKKLGFLLTVLFFFLMCLYSLLKI